MNILITGGTGFVGKHLATSLHEKRHHTYILTRSPSNYHNTENTTFISYEYPVEELPIIHGVINLAGESLFGYWSEKKKESILASRIEITEKLVDMMTNMNTKPEVFISGSAVGYYGISNDLIYTEATEEPGEDFLAKVSIKWEKTAKLAEDIGVRTVFTRFGVILGEEGALPYMSIPVKMFAGGKIGNGEQWMSWIHIEDVVNLIQFCLYNRNIDGPVNVTAPHPKRNKDFTKALAKVLKRPHWFTAPAPLIRLTTGEMSTLITKGQYVLPKKALDNNFQFSYPNLEEALRQIKQQKA
ncbi:TIGR01777 family oxidoreductase [Virgibacillus sp. C22-A2]|uniref:TIGR01777 family oxidoreductase n=1 Tax=Virgibacillus tibetensis TaxID=3042313 RepID=A0ABU6KIA6_9BACI|nr:TIGR01777 family oxidoreductase [Virgibacillus sp. C22-A2]